MIKDNHFVIYCEQTNSTFNWYLWPRAHKENFDLRRHAFMILYPNFLFVQIFFSFLSRFDIIGFYFILMYNLSVFFQSCISWGGGGGGVPIWGVLTSVKNLY